MKFILASKSPRRKEILNKINLKFKIVPSTIDESKISTKMNPIDYCTKLAELKAKDISNQYHDCTVIGADTIVYHKNKIMGKPLNKKEAFTHLKSLSNSSHYVYTAVSLICKAENINEKIIDSTIVTFNKLYSEDINFYINNFRIM